jgi:hypothetical protein
MISTIFRDGDSSRIYFQHALSITQSDGSEARRADFFHLTIGFASFFFLVISSSKQPRSKSEHSDANTAALNLGRKKWETFELIKL